MDADIRWEVGGRRAGVLKVVGQNIPFSGLSRSERLRPEFLPIISALHADHFRLILALTATRLKGDTKHHLKRLAIQ